MVEKKQQEKKNGFSLDWLVGGVLTKVGESLDRITGRGWNPSSSLATSKLIEKLKFLLDEEVRQAGSGWFAPHIITLKIQWNKFAADSGEDLENLTDELHAAAIDHINDKLYHTYGPIEISIKNDYFTEGVRLIGSFGKFGDADDEAAVNVTLPNITIDTGAEGHRVSINLEDTPMVSGDQPLYLASFEIGGRKYENQLDFASAKRFSVGRGMESDLALDDKSVSKVHASLVLNGEGKLLVADTGSTNGTYVLGRRIPYGKAVEIANGEIVSFGTVNVEFKEFSQNPRSVENEVAGSLEESLDSPADSPRLTNKSVPSDSQSGSAEKVEKRSVMPLQPDAPNETVKESIEEANKKEREI